MPRTEAKVRKPASDLSSISPDELQARLSKNEAEAEFDELTLLTNVNVGVCLLCCGASDDSMVGVWWRSSKVGIWYVDDVKE